MAASDIVIHKGEKEEKYQLYVEDYVMSYLKNYGAGEGGKIFFYGKREQKNKKYYIYGAGHQRELSYFAQYEPLDEIKCRLTSDIPVFLMENKKETYELAGYYIFYQSNEAMQNYMVEQRKTAEAMEKSKNRSGAQTGRKSGQQTNARPQKIIRPQIINRPQANRQHSMNSGQDMNGGQNMDGGQSANRAAAGPAFVKTGRPAAGKRMAGNAKGGIMTMQLAAIFIILIAIVINSTNSYTKLEELNNAAVEVFFTMENEDASGNENADTTLQTEDFSDTGAEGTVLRLEDLDIGFEEENQVAKKEEGDGSENEGGQNESDTEAGAGQDKTEGSGNGITGQTQPEDEDGNKEEDNGRQEEAAGNSNQDNREDREGQKDDETENNAGKESAQAEETVQSEQAFARNFAEYYKIEKGDTLYKISIKIYGDTGKVEEICELNKIKDPDNIKYGQKILLP